MTGAAVCAWRGAWVARPSGATWCTRRKPKCPRSPMRGLLRDRHRVRVLRGASPARAPVAELIRDEAGRYLIARRGSHLAGFWSSSGSGVSSRRNTRQTQVGVPGLDRGPALLPVAGRSRDDRAARVADDGVGRPERLDEFDFPLADRERVALLRARSASLVLQGYGADLNVPPRPAFSLEVTLARKAPNSRPRTTRPNTALVLGRGTRRATRRFAGAAAAREPGRCKLQRCAAKHRTLARRGQRH